MKDYREELMARYERKDLFATRVPQGGGSSDNKQVRITIMNV